MHFHVFLVILMHLHGFKLNFVVLIDLDCCMKLFNRGGTDSKENVEDLIVQFERNLIQFGEDNEINFKNICSKKNFNKRMHSIGVRLYGKKERLESGMNGMYKETQLRRVISLCNDFKSIIKLKNLPFEFDGSGNHGNDNNDRDSDGILFGDDDDGWL